jgi:hypothetical protein
MLIVAGAEAVKAFGASREHGSWFHENRICTRDARTPRFLTKPATLAWATLDNEKLDAFRYQFGPDTLGKCDPRREPSSLENER